MNNLWNENKSANDMCLYMDSTFLKWFNLQPEVYICTYSQSIQIFVKFLRCFLWTGILTCFDTEADISCLLDIPELELLNGW